MAAKRIVHDFVQDLVQMFVHSCCTKKAASIQAVYAFVQLVQVVFYFLHVHVRARVIGDVFVLHQVNK